MGRRVALAAGLALAGAAALALHVARLALEPVAPVSVQRAVFAVSPGEALGHVARRLEREGLVKSGLAFVALARWRGLESALQVGEYELSPAMTPGEVLEHMVSGRVVTYEVVIPEGFTLVQIAERLAAQGLVKRDAFLHVIRDPSTARALAVEGNTLEGYLFPETYRLPKGLPPLEVARALVEQFRRVWTELEPLAAQRDFSMKEVVTLASIVEKETGAPSERPLIASVFVNRLERGMRLETDPTVIYGIPDFDGNLRRSDLENAENPYNTYRIAGLPPGPIASPGRESLLAVVQPAQSDYLYFVSRNDGTHVFSRSYREHANAVDRFQRRRSR
jgi:UPF0755 protein